MNNILSTIFLILLLLTSCQPAPTPKPVPPPPPSVTPTTALPTKPPPTETLTATPLPEPTPTFPPAIVASSPEQIAGVWRLKNFRGQGGLVNFPADLTFRQDGTFSFDEIDDPMHIFGGKLLFADGTVTLDSDECYDEAKALFYHCTMTFTIYTTLVAGKPVRIRLESDQETGVFVVNVRGKNLYPSVP
jgi:hypothetical protein